MNRSLLSAAYLILAGEAIIGVIVLFVVLLPLQRQIQADRTQVKELSAAVTERENFLETIDEKQRSLDQKKSDELLLAVALPTDNAIDDSIRVLHTAANVSGLSISSIQNTSANELRSVTSRRAQGQAISLPENIVPLGLDVDVEGTYQQIRVFLEQIENAPRLMDIMSIEMSRPQDEVEILGANFSIRLYQQQIVQ